MIGLIFYFLLKMFKLTTLGLIITIIFGAIGFAIGTFKIPETTAFKFTKATGGEKIDDIILRWIKFKRKANRIYVYKKEEGTEDE